MPWCWFWWWYPLVLEKSMYFRNSLFSSKIPEFGGKNKLSLRWNLMFVYKFLVVKTGFNSRVIFNSRLKKHSYLVIIFPLNLEEQGYFWRTWTLPRPKDTTNRINMKASKGKYKIRLSVLLILKIISVIRWLSSYTGLGNLFHKQKVGIVLAWLLSGFLKLEYNSDISQKVKRKEKLTRK